jgi:hypothetical protein
MNFGNFVEKSTVKSFRRSSVHDLGWKAKT